jgi:hypothetical protein
MSAEDVVVAYVAMDEAYPAYVEAEEFYDGTVDEFFSSERVARLVASTGQPYRFNFAKIPVKSLVGRVELRGLGIPDDEKATALLKDIYAANDFEALYPDIITTAFKYGDAYVLVLPYDEADDVEGFADDEIVEVGQEAILINPKDARLIYDPDNDRRKMFFARRWCDDSAAQDERIHRVELHYNNRVEYWETLRGKDPTRPESWVPTQADEATAFGQVPAFHYRTEKPYGVPVHKDAYGPQLAINKLLITQLTTSEAAGWPQRYGLTEEGGVLDQATDGPNWDADEDAPAVTAGDTTRRGGVGSNVRGGPGTMQMWTGMKEVGQFDAADSSKYFMGPAMQYISIMSVLTDTPLHDFEKSIIPPSGESRKVAERPLTNKAKFMQRRFRGTISEQWRFAMKLAGRPVPRVDVRWAPAYMAEDLHDWQTIETQQRCGVPVDQTLHEAGYDDEQVKAWLDGTAEAMPLAQRVGLVAQIADAMATMTNASLSASGVADGDSGMAAIKVLLAQAMQQNTNPA